MKQARNLLGAWILVAVFGLAIVPPVQAQTDVNNTPSTATTSYDDDDGPNLGWLGLLGLVGLMGLRRRNTRDEVHSGRPAHV